MGDNHGPTTLGLRQLFEEETSTHTFLLFDEETNEGVLIDCVKEKVERDLKLMEELGISLKYLLETHVHADHITGADDIRQKTGAAVVYGALAGVECADINLADGAELSFGKFKVKGISTPGHTSGCTSYLIENMVFTGDTILIRGCGRTDFQQGSAQNLYESVNNKLFTLPQETMLFPAHDYKGMWLTTIAEEKQYNPRLGQGKSLAEFVEIMDNLNLAYPKKIDVSVPSNLKCGKTD